MAAIVLVSGTAHATDASDLIAEGIKAVAYQETSSYRVTRDFLASPERFLKHLLDLKEG